MASEEVVPVHYFRCDCPWWTKYCNEHHRQSFLIPLSVLKAYEVTA